jgi:hypothetical protein
MKICWKWIFIHSQPGRSTADLIFDAAERHRRRLSIVLLQAERNLTLIFLLENRHHSSSKILVVHPLFTNEVIDRYAHGKSYIAYRGRGLRDASVLLSSLIRIELG